MAQQWAPNYGVPGLPQVNLNPTEQPVYEAVYARADPNRTGAVSNEVAISMLRRTNLQNDVLGKIWQQVDSGRGQLDRNGVFLALKLVALAQNGQDPVINNLPINVPPPFVDGVTPPQGMAAQPAQARASLSGPSQNWQITPAEKAGYDQFFNQLQPVNGRVSGKAVGDFLLQSNLPPQTLAQIWSLADSTQAGTLDSEEFAVAMYLVTQAKNGASVPQQLPPFLVPPSQRAKQQMPPQPQPQPQPQGPFSQAGATFFNQPQPMAGVGVPSMPSQPTLPPLGQPTPFPPMQGPPQAPMMSMQGQMGSQQGQVPQMPMGTMSASMQLGPSPSTQSPVVGMGMGMPQQQGAAPGNTFAPVAKQHTGMKPPTMIPTSPFGGSSAPPQPQQAQMPQMAPQPQAQGFPKPAFPTSQAPQAAAMPGLGSMLGAGSDWVVPAAEKAGYDAFFAQADRDHDGIVLGPDVAPIFQKSNLPVNELANIWNLVDFQKSGRLDADQFALAMFIIKKRINAPQDPIPIPLPPEYIPPSWRGKIAPLSPATQQSGSVRSATSPTPAVVEGMPPAVTRSQSFAGPPTPASPLQRPPTKLPSISSVGGLMQPAAMGRSGTPPASMGTVSNQKALEEARRLADQKVGLESEIKDLDMSVQQKTAEGAETERQIQELHQALAQLTQQREQQQAVLQQAEQHLDALRMQQVRVREDLERERAMVMHMQAAVNEVTAQVAKEEAELGNLTRELAAAQAQREQLEREQKTKEAALQSIRAAAANTASSRPVSAGSLDGMGLAGPPSFTAITSPSMPLQSPSSGLGRPTPAGEKGPSQTARRGPAPAPPKTAGTFVIPPPPPTNPPEETKEKPLSPKPTLAAAPVASPAPAPVLSPAPPSEPTPPAAPAPPPAPAAPAGPPKKQARDYSALEEFDREFSQQLSSSRPESTGSLGRLPTGGNAPLPAVGSAPLPAVGSAPLPGVGSGGLASVASGSLTSIPAATQQSAPGSPQATKKAPGSPGLGLGRPASPPPAVPSSPTPPAAPAAVGSPVTTKPAPAVDDPFATVDHQPIARVPSSEDPFQEAGDPFATEDPFKQAEGSEDPFAQLSGKKTNDFGDDDPFGTPLPAPATSAASSDPFGAFGSAPAPANGASPFGDSDPFASAFAKPAASTSSPFASGADPFAATPFQPAATGSDPFGGDPFASSFSAPAVGSDPFASFAAPPPQKAPVSPKAGAAPSSPSSGRAMGQKSSKGLQGMSSEEQMQAALELSKMQTSAANTDLSTLTEEEQLRLALEQSKHDMTPEEREEYELKKAMEASLHEK